jgi:mycothiol system anti-sigma-R factor
VTTSSVPGPCGRSDDTDCSEVLERVFFFIDNELPTADFAQIQHHLDECGPCLAKYDLERTVKQLVQRSCCEQAPVTLREKVLLRIRQVQTELHQD